MDGTKPLGTNVPKGAERPYAQCPELLDAPLPKRHEPSFGPDCHRTRELEWVALAAADDTARAEGEWRDVENSHAATIAVARTRGGRQNRGTASRPK